MLNRPRRVYGTLLPLLVLTFGVSAIGKDKTPSEGGTYWIGASGWTAFCVLLLITVVFTVVVAVRALGQRSTPGVGR